MVKLKSKIYTITDIKKQPTDTLFKDVKVGDDIQVRFFLDDNFFESIDTLDYQHAEVTNLTTRQVELGVNLLCLFKNLSYFELEDKEFEKEMRDLTRSIEKNLKNIRNRGVV